MKEEITFKRLVILMFASFALYGIVRNFAACLNFVKMILSVCYPLALGGAIAFVTIVPLRFVESHLLPNNRKFDKYRRGVSYIITLLLIFAVMGLVLGVVIPQVVDALSQIVQKLPKMVDSLYAKAVKFTNETPIINQIITEFNIDGDELQEEIINFAKKYGSSFFNTGAGVVSGVAGGILGFAGGITNVLIAFIFSIYIVLQKEKFASQAKQVIYALFKEEKADKIVYIGRLSARVFSNFISGQCIEACILGTMFFITLLIFKIPYSLLVSVIITVTALIPIFGAFIGMAIGAFLIVLVSPWKALYFIIIFFVLQQIEGNLIYPHVVGGSIGLPSLWVLFAVTVGGSLFGVGGILIFIPLCSVMYALFRDHVQKKLVKKEIAVEKYVQISADESKLISDQIENEMFRKEEEEEEEKKEGNGFFSKIFKKKEDESEDKK